jgi:hypothetical protein
MELTPVKDCKFVHRHLSLMRQENSMLLMSAQQLLSHVKWSYCWRICRSLHREPSDNLLGELQNVISLLTVCWLFCSEGQVQEEMKKLKIINRSWKSIQLTKLDGDIQIGDTITIAPDQEYKYACHSEMGDKTIRLRLPHENPIRKPFVYLNADFMQRNKIAYVRKGAHDCWFVDPIRRGVKLVRKCVHNSTASRIVVREFVLERIGETKRVPEKIDAATWTAWWGITVASRSKDLLIVDPVAVENKDRRYFGGKAEDNIWRQQNDNVNGDIDEIKMTKHAEHVEVKERSDGMLDWTPSRRRWFLV